MKRNKNTALYPRSERRGFSAPMVSDLEELGPSRNTLRYMRAEMASWLARKPLPECKAARPNIDIMRTTPNGATKPAFLHPMRLFKPLESLELSLY
jgi:hypothetical protein